MDSQENAQNMSEIEEQDKVEQAPQVEESTPVEADANVEQKPVYTSKEEILERVREIAHSDEAPKKEEIDYLKTSFYKLHIAERDAAYKEYLEKDGNPDEYTILPDDVEEAFKAEMIVIREKRASILKELEEEKERNLRRKQEIIEKIKSMATSPEEANKEYQEFKALQQEWKEIKNVPASHANELWRTYQLYVEQFYDLLKLNSEAREYDFKKNLELKTKLCETAERLADEPDVISAFYQLQKLHDEYREIGPVAKELREQVWARFKAASTVINKRHQQYYEDQRAKEGENLERKTALCEKAEEIVAHENKTAIDWEKATKEIIDLQAEWKTIGFAPQKMNVKIFERFRSTCDVFFSRKAEFFKHLKESYKKNIDKKRELIAKAKEMMDSTDWKSTSDKFISLQKEWKSIGVTPRKIGDQLWAEFLGACNHFFENRNANTSGQRSQEHANLEKKRDVIERLKAILDDASDNAQAEVQKLIEEFNGIGHVPFKEKDKVYDEFHATIDQVYKKLNITVAKKTLNNFKNKIKNAAAKGENALDSERARLLRQYEALKSDVQTYENNLGFLNAQSKKGNSLIDEMNRKVQKLKDDMNLVREKIKAIDAEYKE